jgi:membrane protein required for colicin V production
MAEWSFSLGSLTFNMVDVIIIALAGMSAIVGAVRGFALEFSARAGFLVGFVVALIFSQLGANLIGETFDVPLLVATLIAFVILFIIGYAAMMIVGSLLDKTLDALGLDWLDRLLGLFLGVIEVGVVVAFVVYILELQQVIDLSAYIDPSIITTRLIKPLTPKGLELVKGIV